MTEFESNIIAFPTKIDRTYIEALREQQKTAEHALTQRERQQHDLRGRFAKQLASREMPADVEPIGKDILSFYDSFGLQRASTDNVRETSLAWHFPRQGRGFAREVCGITLTRRERGERPSEFTASIHRVRQDYVVGFGYQKGDEESRVITGTSDPNDATHPFIGFRGRSFQNSITQITSFCEDPEESYSNEYLWGQVSNRIKFGGIKIVPTPPK